MKVNLPLCSLLMAIIAFPWGARAEKIDASKLAGNLREYPYVETPPPAQTPPPPGYEPFHMEHYGRHGSRWLIGKEDYSVPVEKLEKAERARVLTQLGEKTLNALRRIKEASRGREGELSDKGALQHQAIGRRMALNYPEIFNDSADIDAKSTIVIRCILSMANALQGIQEVVPGIHPTKDASEADMWFMNFNDRKAWPVKDSVDRTLLAEYRKNLIKSSDYLDRLVSDPQFARDSVAPGLMPRLYWVLGNTQSHTGQPWLFEEVFSEEDLIENWKAGNAGWFSHGGNSPMTRGRMPFVQRNLLGRIIEQTDSAIANGSHGARLRYGHDGILISIITLMELGGYGDPVESFEALENTNWKDYDIIPMGSNLQLVFYRNPSRPDSILVKAMINEEEVTMPGVPVSGPYYDWNTLRSYYLDKLSSFSE